MAFTQQSLSKTKAHPRPPIQLKKGQQWRFYEPELARYSLGSDIIRVRYWQKKKTLLIKAIARGNTDLWIWRKDGSLWIQPIEIRTDFRKFHEPLPRWIQSLQSFPSLTIHPLSKERFLVRGQIHSLESARILDPILEQHQDQIINRIQWDPAPQFIPSGDHAIFKQNPSLTYHPEERTIYGVVRSAEKATHLNKKLSQFFPLISRNIQVHPHWNQFAYFSIYLLSVSRNAELTHGIHWDTSPMQNWTTLKRIQNLSQKIELDQQNGHLKVLSHPQIAVSIPGEAKLFSGTEIPIRQNTQFSSELSWKTAGLEVKLNALSATQDWLSLKIKTLVSQPDHASQNAQDPRIRSNWIETQVRARFQHTLMIGGLSQLHTQSQTNGVPILSDLPLLKHFFSFSTQSDHQSDLVVLITPNRLPPHKINQTEFSLKWPLGAVPSPRNQMSEVEIQNLKNEKDYPWNALQ